MNQFPPVLLKLFGEAWFQSGNLSLLFRNPTIDKERVRVFAESPRGSQTMVRMEREDGLLVCQGTAALGDHSQSELRARDMRACDPSELKILSRIEPGQSLGEYDLVTSPELQFERYDKGLISDPLDWYRGESPWGEPVAAPCTIIQYLWGYPMKVLGPLANDAVGLFGAIEIGFINRPFLMNHAYHIESHVVCVGQSPQTEYVWYESTAFATSGEPVANMLMQSRVMKASSPLYQLLNDCRYKPRIIN